VRTQLRLRIEPPAGAVEIDVPALVKPRELAAAELVKNGCVRVGRMAAKERALLGAEL